MKQVLFLTAAVLVMLSTVSGTAATSKTLPGKSSPALTTNAIKNSSFPLPRLSQGYDMIKFQQGHYKEGDTAADINMIALGTLDDNPAAVGFVIWNTGGTGYFEVLGLYRLVAGKPECVGWFDLEDRATVNSLRIANNHVVLNWLKHGPSDPASFPSVHEVKKLTAQQFDAIKQAE